ncbi:hypothetical protein A9Q84_03515 [Halobacteriovorax marinus]|uniref:ABC-2 type transporter transmembrane domain-containing protein n=1 Tax=Halobacteriovorax marinus TaxID=97084 RepID=A0A1Y5FA54_9BACT|nr:hypothetical protein A9Q84_03515 [Halobacteriovorax marinus]
MFSIFKRELKEALSSPLFYILCAIFSAIVGWLFYNYILGSKEHTGTTLTNNVLIPLFGVMNSLFMFFSPILTMNSFVEEKNSGTLDLLLRSKVSIWEIILGKFLSHVTLISLMLSLSIICPLILMFSGYSDWGIVGSAYLGLILNISCYIIVGLFASSLTENQIVSGFVSFSIILGILLVNLTANTANSFIVGQIFNYLNNISHFSYFVKGDIRSYSFIYYSSFVGLFMLFTSKSLESRRW